MNSDRLRILALCAVPLLLAGCETAVIAPPNAAAFGEPNRQTMMAQVIDPDPRYDEAVPPTSAEHAAQAADRYSKDKVKQPPRVRSTVGSGGGGGGGGSGGGN